MLESYQRRSLLNYGIHHDCTMKKAAVTLQLLAVLPRLCASSTEDKRVKTSNRPLKGAPKPAPRGVLSLPCKARAAQLLTDKPF